MFDTTSVVFKFQCVVEPLEKIVKPKWWDPTKRLGISRSGVEFQISISNSGPLHCVVLLQVGGDLLLGAVTKENSTVL